MNFRKSILFSLLQQNKNLADYKDTRSRPKFGPYKRNHLDCYLVITNWINIEYNYFSDKRQFIKSISKYDCLYGKVM